MWDLPDPGDRKMCISASLKTIPGTTLCFSPMDRCLIAGSLNGDIVAVNVGGWEYDDEPDEYHLGKFGEQVTSRW